MKKDRIISTTIIVLCLYFIFLAAKQIINFLTPLNYGGIPGPLMFSWFWMIAYILEIIFFVVLGLSLIKGYKWGLILGIIAPALAVYDYVSGVFTSILRYNLPFWNLSHIRNYILIIILLGMIACLIYFYKKE